MATLRVNLPPQGLPVTRVARLIGIPLNTLKHLCISGQVLGARRDRLTWQWWMFPPGLLIRRPH